MDFKNICLAVIVAATDNRNNGGLQYADTYAREGLRIANRGADEHAIKVQARYIRTNLSTWRGDKAKEVKAELDKLTA